MVAFLPSVRIVNSSLTACVIVCVLEVGGGGGGRSRGYMTLVGPLSESGSVLNLKNQCLLGTVLPWRCLHSCVSVCALVRSSSRPFALRMPVLLFVLCLRELC